LVRQHLFQTFRNNLTNERRLQALIRLTDRVWPAAQESKGGRNMGLFSAASRYFCNPKRKVPRVVGNEGFNEYLLRPFSLILFGLLGGKSPGS